MPFLHAKKLGTHQENTIECNSNIKLLFHLNPFFHNNWKSVVTDVHNTQTNVSDIIYFEAVLVIHVHQLVHQVLLVYPWRPLEELGCYNSHEYVLSVFPLVLLAFACGALNSSMC